jgi:hypothetical protein
MSQGEVVLVTAAKSGGQFGFEGFLIVGILVAVLAYIFYFKGHPERLTKVKGKLSKVFSKAKKKSGDVDKFVQDLTRRAAANEKQDPLPDKVEPVLSVITNEDVAELKKTLIAQHRIILQQERELTDARKLIQEQLAALSQLPPTPLPTNKVVSVVTPPKGFL